VEAFVEKAESQRPGRELQPATAISTRRHAAKLRVAHATAAEVVSAPLHVSGSWQRHRFPAGIDFEFRMAVSLANFIGVWPGNVTRKSKFCSSANPT
jgi:hypothetical protein